jgi:hypothetical protein
MSLGSSGESREACACHLPTLFPVHSSSPTYLSMPSTLRTLSPVSCSDRRVLSTGSPAPTVACRHEVPDIRTRQDIVTSCYTSTPQDPHIAQHTNSALDFDDNIYTLKWHCTVSAASQGTRYPLPPVVRRYQAVTQRRTGHQQVQL